jgi:AcrR family transcriptional regulator
MISKRTSARRPGRPRNQKKRQIILRAANELLKEQGIAAMTIEAVAARSGVAKTTIYRWWPTKGALAIEGFLAEMSPKLTYPDSGSTLVDLKKQLLRVVATFRSKPGLVIASMIAEAQRDPDTMTAFLQGYVLPRREVGKKVFLRGIERGELRPNLDIEAAIDALYGPLYYRLLIGRNQLTEVWANKFVDIIFRGMVRTDNVPTKRPRRNGRGKAATEVHAVTQ